MRSILTQEELLKELQQLAALDAGQEYSLQQEYQYEVNNDGELQAQAWRFGRYYQEAIRNATTIAEIEMLHQAAIMWLRLQMESGLPVTIDKIKAEAARIAPKENEIVNEYDAASIPILKKYLADMKNDIYNELRASIGSSSTGSMRDSSFARKGGKPRMYSTSTSNIVPVKEKQTSMVPTFGWKSNIPGTTEYQLKQLVNSMDQLVKEMEQKGVADKDISRYKELRAQYAQLMPDQDYNPLKEKSSLLVNEAKRYLSRLEPESGFFPESMILKQLYDLGIRLSTEEIADIVKSTGWDAFAKRLADKIEVIQDTNKLTIESIGIPASLIVSSYRLFQSFGIDITPYFGRSFNMEAMAWLSSEWLSIKQATNQEVFTGGSVNGKPVYANARLDNLPLSYLKSDVILGMHMSRAKKAERDPYRDYPIGYGQQSIETNPAAPILKEMRKDNYKYLNNFIANAKNAGFFRSEGPQALALSANSFKDMFKQMYNQLMRDGVYQENEPLFRKFIQEYALDKLKHKLDLGEITQENYDSIQPDIAALHSARDAYFATKK